MASSSNPYAPPGLDAVQADRLPSEQLSPLRRDGDLLLIQSFGARFPDRCVVCNQPATRRIERKLHWHPPAYYLLLVFGVLYLLIAFRVLQRAKVQLSVCDRHYALRRRWILAGWIGTALLLSAILAFPEPLGLFGMAALNLSMCALLVYTWHRTRLVSAKRIDPHHAWLEVGRPFLDSISASSGSPDSAGG